MTSRRYNCAVFAELDLEGTAAAVHKGADGKLHIVSDQGGTAVTKELNAHGLAVGDYVRIHEEKGLVA
jgi:hypothetical protein